MTAKVLIVDDLPANIRLLNNKLITKYYNVLTASSGSEAIEIAKDKQPDIILLDVMMPEMDGYETCRRLKSNHKVAHIPIVMITALDNTTDNRVNGLRAGADDFLTKPINDIALFARINSLTRLKMVSDELRLRGKTNSEMNIVDSEIIDYVNQVHNARILIIDEDKVRSEIMNSVLRQYFKEVVISYHLDQALELVSVGNYDLIIVDKYFNGDGLRICSQFRNKIETRYTPVLILFDEEISSDMLSEIFDIGINEYIVTPVDSNELVARVNVQVKRKRYQDKLRMNLDNRIAMSISDPLTGCYNRHYFDLHFQNILEDSIVKDRDLSLMMIDIDYFKQVNDTFGHTAGDSLLKQLQKRVLNNIRVTDLLARFGGEEFVVILPDTHLGDARKVGEKVRKIIDEEPFLIDSSDPIHKTVSIGITEMLSNDTAIQFINRTDQCLYKAKNSGRNRVICG